MLPLLTRVHRNRTGTIIVLTCLICIIAAKSAFAQTNLPTIIRLGIRTAAYPIGHVVDSDGSVKFGGFCDVFIQELENQLRQEGRNIPVVAQVIRNQYTGGDKGGGYPRYDGLINDHIDIECGSNSISSLYLLDEKGEPFINKIDYARPSFYTTGIKLLLKKKEARKLNSLMNRLSQSKQEKALRNLSIGVLDYTTTRSEIEQAAKGSDNFYLNRKTFDLQDDQSSARDAALNELEEGSIQAFASDAVILETLLKEGVQEDLPYQHRREPYKKDYTLFPAKPGAYLPYLHRQDCIIAVQRKPVGYSATDLKSLIHSVLIKSSLNVDEREKIKNYELEQGSIITWFPTGLWIGLLLFIAFLGFLVWHFKKRPRSSSKHSSVKRGENIKVNNHPKKSAEPGRSEYQFGSVGNIQINNHHSAGTQNNIVSAQSQDTIDDLKRLIGKLQQKYPRASETQASVIIDAEFESIEHAEPDRWQKFLSLKRVWNGIRNGSLKASEHFAEETPWGKAILGFLEGVTDDV